MLQIQRPTKDALKIGEVFLLKTEYIISCMQCKIKIQFTDFQRHFLKFHLTPTQQEDLYNLIALGQSEGEDPIGIAAEAEYKIKEERDVEEVIFEVYDDNTSLEVRHENYDEVVEFEQFEPKEHSTDEVTAIGTALAAKEAQNPSDDGVLKSLERRSSDASDDFASSDSWNSTENANSFTCPICERNYKSKKALADHTRQVHGKWKRKTAAKKREKNLKEPTFQCEKCGESFFEEIHLKRHDMKKHTGIRCDICNRSFSQIPNMERHKMRHYGVKDVECEDCGKLFFTKKERDAHTLIHTRNYRKVCEVCGKLCADGGVLRLHMRRHTGERPYECKVCGKGFFSGYDRNIHEAGHSDKRPCECDVCGGKFRYPRALRVHKKIHVKERNFACDICDKRFINEKGVKEHMRSHLKTALVCKVES